MAARAKAKRAKAVKPKKATKATKAVKAVKDVKTEEEAVARRPLSFRKKLLIIIAVLALGYVLFSSKELFVAATVNGYPVSRLSVVRELERQGGRQVLDNLISEMLIIQEARKAGITVSPADIDAKINSIKEQAKAQGEDIDAILTVQGISQDEFRRQVKTQLFVEKLLSDKVSITDEEVTKFIATNKSFLSTDLDEDGLKKLAQEQLTQQKLSAQYATWIADVRAKSDINYFVEY